MKALKKIVLMIFLVLMLIRFAFGSLLMSASAMMAGPAAAEALEVFIEAVLVATGAVSSSQLDSLDFDQKQTILTDGLNSGSISKNDFLTYATNPGLLFAKGYIENADTISLVQTVAGKVISDWLDSCFSDNEVLEDVLAPTTDLQGYGCFIYDENSMGIHHTYGDYAELWYDSKGTLNYTVYNYFRTYDSGSLHQERSGSSFGASSSGYDIFRVSGDIRWRDTGEQASDSEYYVDASPSADTVIGTLDDGTEVTAGDVISGAVDPSKVKPKYDAYTDLGLSDLIDRLLRMLSDSSSVTDSTDLTDKVIDDVGDVALELEGLDGLTVPTSVAHVFPFCLPWDLVQGMYLFNAEPDVPEFTFDITVPSFLNVPEQHWKLDINLKDFETLAIITRWGFMVLFVYNLILLTGRIVKGAGA